MNAVTLLVCAIGLVGQDVSIPEPLVHQETEELFLRLKSSWAVIADIAEDSDLTDIQKTDRLDEQIKELDDYLRGQKWFVAFEIDNVIQSERRGYYTFTLDTYFPPDGEFGRLSKVFEHVTMRVPDRQARRMKPGDFLVCKGTIEAGVVGDSQRRNVRPQRQPIWDLSLNYYEQGGRGNLYYRLQLKQARWYVVTENEVDSWFDSLEAEPEEEAVELESLEDIRALLRRVDIKLERARNVLSADGFDEKKGGIVDREIDATRGVVVLPVAAVESVDDNHYLLTIADEARGDFKIPVPVSAGLPASQIEPDSDVELTLSLVDLFASGEEGIAEPDATKGEFVLMGADCGTLLRVERIDLP